MALQPLEDQRERIVGPFRQIRLGDDDRAGGLKPVHQRRVVRTQIPGERQRTCRRHCTGQIDIVLDDDGDAMQRSADLPRAAFPIQRLWLRNSAWD